MKLAIFLSGVLLSNSALAGSIAFVKYADLLKGKPVIEGPNVKVWRVKQDDVIRVNLVQFSGTLSRHIHPDADHSLMILDGKVEAEVSGKKYLLTKGDFISIPKNDPHGYRSVSIQSTFVSMDAPYYDPTKTIRIEK